MTNPSQKFIDFLKTQSIEDIASTMIELQREVDMLISNHKPEPICNLFGTLPVYDNQTQQTQVAEVKLDDTGYPYVDWSGDESTFYERHPAGTKFFVNTSREQK